MDLSLPDNDPSATSDPRYQTSSWERLRDADTRLPDDFAVHLREIARPLQVAYQRLMVAYAGEPVGIECRLKERDSWAFVLPEASGDKPWRIQQFDQDGFVGHLCFNSVAEAVEDMLRQGYLVVEPGALDRVAATPRWSVGVRRGALIQKHNAGLMTYREMLAEMEAIAA